MKTGDLKRGDVFRFLDSNVLCVCVGMSETCVHYCFMNDEFRYQVSYTAKNVEVCLIEDE